MHEDLIDDHLHKERHEQREELEKEGRHEDFAQKRVLLDEDRNKPGEIELQILQTEMRAFGKEH